MARLAIMSALHEELAALLERLRADHDPTAGHQPGSLRAARGAPAQRMPMVQVAGRQFWQTQWQGHDVVLVLSRIGKVAAATTASVLIERFGVDRILFSGVAGGLADGVAVGDVVVASACLQHDMDASPLFARHQVPLYGLDRFVCDARMSACLVKAATEVLRQAPNHLGRPVATRWGLAQARVHQGLVVSGDRFVSSVSESQTLRQDLPQALAVEMECAAVAQVCHDFGVRFAAVRTISDRADASAATDFNRFLTEVASPYSAAIVTHCLDLM
ncbi:MAG: 5'-methylthioadenosine/adenosylhomocysteine nucleosidase [Betaproteobacteria bacterium]|nr:5'-methylthioadenosine/adenosylhomocysteine nucleosidase [Betaproteobacteria bacterium]